MFFGEFEKNKILVARDEQRNLKADLGPGCPLGTMDTLKLGEAG